jgi:predicted RNA binding protein YcfA (HicA-like mRNA interferase family)
MNGGRLPTVTGRQVLRALSSAGFVLDRVVGSHHVLKHPQDARRTVTVPIHSGKDLKRGTLRSIIRQAGFSVEEFTKLL